MNKTINLGQLGSDQVEAFHANLYFSIPHLAHNPFRDTADVFFVILNRFELTVHHQWSLIGKMWRSSCDVPPNFSDPNTAFGSNFWGHVTPIIVDGKSQKIWVSETSSAFTRIESTLMDGLKPT